MSFTNQAKSYSVYAGGTTYAVGDVVIYVDDLYICIAASTGNLPTDTDYWENYFTNQTINSISPTNQAKS